MTQKLVFLLFLAMVFFGFQQFFYKLSAQKIGAAQSFVILSSVLFVCSVIMYYVLPHEGSISLSMENKTNYLYPILAGFTASISFYSFLLATEIVPITISAPMRNIGLVITLILGFFVLKEEITLLKGLGLGFGLIAIILLAR